MPKEVREKHCPQGLVMLQSPRPSPSAPVKFGCSHVLDMFPADPAISTVVVMWLSALQPSMLWTEPPCMDLIDYLFKTLANKYSPMDQIHYL